MRDAALGVDIRAGDSLASGTFARLASMLRRLEPQARAARDRVERRRA